MKPINLFVGNKEIVDILDTNRGKCCRNVYKLQTTAYHKAQNIYEYEITCYLAEICPYLGFNSAEKKLYCAGGHMDDDCIELWKGKIPYNLVLLHTDQKRVAVIRQGTDRWYELMEAL